MQDFPLTYQQATRPYVAFASDICGRLIKQAGVLLDDLSRKASGSEQARYQSDIAALQAFEKKLPLAFGKRMAGKFEQFLEGVELSEKETLDAQPQDLSNEVVRIVDCLTNHVAEPLWHLNMRFALLRGGTKTTDYTNPMGPAQFCGALCAELGKQSASHRLQLLLFRLIEKHLPDRLARFYDDANRSLVAAGVFPHLRYYLIASNGGGGIGPASAFDVDAIDSAAEVEKEAQLHLTAMVRAQAARRDETLRKTALGTLFGRMDTEGRGGADTFTEVDIAFAVVAMTTRYPIPRGRVYRSLPPLAKLESQLIEHLLKAGEHTGRQRMKRAMAESFSRMGAVFNTLLEDHYLGSEQRDLIGHLYFPMLKIGMLEPRFWTDPNHAGRRFLGLFCELAEFWVASSHNDRTTYPQLHSAAERLTRDYVDDIAVVDVIIDELGDFAQRIGQRANLTLNRTVEAERGMAKVGSAQTFAAEQAHAILASKPVPDLIRESMQKPLTAFFSRLLLRKGEEGDQALVAAGAAVLKALPHGDDMEPESAPEALSAALEAAGGDAVAVQTLLESIRKALQRWQGLETASASQSRSEVKQRGAASPDPLSGLPGQGFGLWFSSTEPGQVTPVLWLLVWASPSPRRYLFVNRLGVRGDLMDDATLQQALSSGRLQPLVGHGNGWVRALRQVASA